MVMAEACALKEMAWVRFFIDNREAEVIIIPVWHFPDLRLWALLYADGASVGFHMIQGQQGVLHARGYVPTY